MTAPAPNPTRRDSEDELLHLVCDHDPDVALCGTPVPGDCWTEEGLDCVVCADLDLLPCGRCGE